MNVHVLGPDRWHAPLFLAAGAGVDCVEHMMVFGALAPEAQRPPEPGRLTPFEYGGWMWRRLADVDPRDEAVDRLSSIA